MTRKKLIRVIAGWIIAIIIFYILFRTIYVNREQLASWKWQVSWPDAVVSCLLLFAAFGTASLGWRSILIAFGHHIKFHEAFRVVYLANLGRYIPGKVWQVFGMVGLAKEVNIPPRVSLASFALAEGYALPAAFLLIPILMGRSESLSTLIVYRDIMYLLIAIVLVVFLILFFLPNGLNWALNKVLRLFRQEEVQYKPSMKNRIAIFMWYVVTWLLFGAAFHFFLTALISTTEFNILFSTGAYIAAYNLGYIAFLSPGGLGIREGVMSALLTPLLGAPIAASIALISRVWITIIEAVITLLALLTYKLKPKKDGPS